MRNTARYILKLANGLTWRIMAVDDAVPWLNEFARILGLPEDHGREPFRGLIVTCGGGTSETLGVDLPEDGWAEKYLMDCLLITHAERDIDVFDLGLDVYEDTSVIKMIRCLAPFIKKVNDSGGLHLHSALLKYRGSGLLLLGSSRTGKSTCCNRVSRHFSVLCDDAVIVVYDTRGQYFAHPFPTWSEYLVGKSRNTWNIENHLPLGALFFLEQAEQDEVLPLGRGEAAAHATRFSMQFFSVNSFNASPEQLADYRKTIFSNASGLVNSVPSYRLRVSLNGNFWKPMEEVLSNMDGRNSPSFFAKKRMRVG